MAAVKQAVGHAALAIGGGAYDGAEGVGTWLKV